MTLADLLSPRRVLVPLRAAAWDEGMRLLLDACVADGMVRHPAGLEAAVREAWPEDTLSLGPHAWLLHLRTDAVTRVVAALGIAPGPVAGPRAAPGGRIVLLILAPPGEAAAYLQTVAAFTRALARPEAVEALHRARAPEDVLRAPALSEVRLEGQLLVRDIMAPVTLSFAPDDPVESSARQLLRQGLDAAPVVSRGGEVVGLLSMRELLRELVSAYVHRVQTGEHPAARRERPGGFDPRTATVREVMARNVLCVSPDQSVAEVATLLANKDVSCIPVVGDGVLCGLLTRAEVVRKVLGQ